ncbi:transposase family protein [Streptomyces sp. NPDC127066]|uniref:transposase family protein n=1 Tax=Streptomyces sp. NPDC127066 TaxID=3347125 RepID=UPI00365126E5
MASPLPRMAVLGLARRALPDFAQRIADACGFLVLAQVLEPPRVGRRQGLPAAWSLASGAGGIDFSRGGRVCPGVDWQGREECLFRFTEHRPVHAWGRLLAEASPAVQFVPQRGPYLLGVALPGGGVPGAVAEHGLVPGAIIDEQIVEHLKAAGLGALADLGFLGVDKPENADDQVIVTGYKATRARKLTPGQKQANRILAAGRAPVEHGFAHLKNWRILTKLRTDPGRATALLRALLVLTDLESSR